MSNTLAIATVTAVLESRITALLNDHGLAGFEVFLEHPKGDDPDPGVYIRSFRIAANPALRNMDLPSRRSDGTVSTRPQLAVDVDFLVSFVGDPTTYDAERLAGLVMTDLHAHPILTANEIDEFLNGLPGNHVLVEADLGDQLERVKLTPISMSVEDLGRIWGLTNQAFYPLSVGYQASVVLLDAEVRPHASLPVSRTGLHVVPGIAPRIETVSSSARRQPLVAVGDNLVVRGSNLLGPTTWLRIGGQTVQLAVDAVTPTSITFPITDGLGLLAGVTSVQVLHRVDLGEGSDPFRTIAGSNAIAFALIPLVTLDQPNALVTSGGLEVRVELIPKPSVDQDVALVLNRIGGKEHSESSVWTFDGDVAVFQVPGMPVGDYLVRARIDGAISLPELDSNGVYAQPAVSVP